MKKEIPRSKCKKYHFLMIKTLQCQNVNFVTNHYCDHQMKRLKCFNWPQLTHTNDPAGLILG